MLKDLALICLGKLVKVELFSVRVYPPIAVDVMLFIMSGDIGGYFGFPRQLIHRTICDRLDGRMND